MLVIWGVNTGLIPLPGFFVLTDAGGFICSTTVLDSAGTSYVCGTAVLNSAGTTYFPI